MAHITAPPRFRPSLTSRFRTKKHRHWGRVLNGEWLQWRRERAGVTINAFCTFWGFGHTTVKKVEANETLPSAEMVRAYRMLPNRKRVRKAALSEWPFPAD